MRRTQFTVRAPVTVVATALLGSCVLACGGSVKSTGTDSRASSVTATDTAKTVDTGRNYAEVNPRRGWDHDGDPGAEHYTSDAPYDRDDAEFRFFGHTASPAQARSIAVLLAHYYSALAKGDSAGACSMLDPSLAGALAGQGGEASHAPHRESSGCEVAVSKQTKHILGRSTAEIEGVKVTGVRVQGDHALALLRLATSEMRYIPVAREHGGWKVEALIDSELG